MKNDPNAKPPATQADQLDQFAVRFGMSLAGWSLTYASEEFVPLDKHQLAVVGVAACGAYASMIGCDPQTDIGDAATLMAATYGETVKKTFLEEASRLEEERFEEREAELAYGAAPKEDPHAEPEEVPTPPAPSGVDGSREATRS